MSHTPEQKIQRQRRPRVSRGNSLGGRGNAGRDAAPALLVLAVRDLVFLSLHFVALLVFLGQAEQQERVKITTVHFRQALEDLWRNNFGREEQTSFLRLLSFAVIVLKMLKQLYK